MGHTSVTRWDVDVSLLSAAFRSSYNIITKLPLDFAEENVVFVRPGQPFGIRQHRSRFAAQHRYNHSCVARQNSVSNARAIGRERWIELVGVVVRELHRLALGKEFYVKLPKD